MFVLINITQKKLLTSLNATNKFDRSFHSTWLAIIYIQRNFVQPGVAHSDRRTHTGKTNSHWQCLWLGVSYTQQLALKQGMHPKKILISEQWYWTSAAVVLNQCSSGTEPLTDTEPVGVMVSDYTSVTEPQYGRTIF